MAFILALNFRGDKLRLDRIGKVGLANLGEQCYNLVNWRLK